MKFIIAINAPSGWMSSCSVTWVATRNSHVSGGERVVSANSLIDCQMACLNRANCSGLNWNSGSRERWRCWLHGPWSGPRIVTEIYGITHFDIKYNCGGENSNYKICPLLGVKQHPCQVVRGIEDNIGAPSASCRFQMSFFVSKQKLNRGEISYFLIRCKIRETGGRTS